MEKTKDIIRTKLTNVYSTIESIKSFKEELDTQYENEIYLRLELLSEPEILKEISLDLNKNANIYSYIHILLGIKYLETPSIYNNKITYKSLPSILNALESLEEDSRLLIKAFLIKNDESCFISNDYDYMTDLSLFTDIFPVNYYALKFIPLELFSFNRSYNEIYINKEIINDPYILKPLLNSLKFICGELDANIFSNKLYKELFPNILICAQSKALNY